MLASERFGKGKRDGSCCYNFDDYVDARGEESGVLAGVSDRCEDLEWVVAEGYSVDHLAGKLSGNEDREIDHEAEGDS